LNLSTSPAEFVPQAFPTAGPAVALNHASFRYGDTLALDEMTLSVARGAVFGLLGPNGSGKSTLISLLVGRRAPDGGDVRILGEPPSPALRRRVGVVFQEPSLDPMMTVRETMQLQARLFDIPSSAAARRSERLLRRVDLFDRERSFTSTLSGGMKRRLELARALLPDPELILLDEPTLALDPDSRQALWEHLDEANAAGCTLLLATNDVYEAERHCHRVALIDHGRVVAQGTPDELKRDLRHDSVRIDWRDAPAISLEALEVQPGVGHVRLAGRTTHVTVDDASAFLARIFQQFGDQIIGVHIERSTLEDVYFQLVGRGIVDERPEVAR